MKYSKWIGSRLSTEISSDDIGISRIIFFALILSEYWDWGSGSAWLINNWEANWMPMSVFQFMPTSWISAQSLALNKFIFTATCFMAMFGLFTRVNIILCALSGFLFLGFPSNFGKIHHSQHFVVVTLILLSCVHEHKWTLDRFLEKRFTSSTQVINKHKKLGFPLNWSIQLLVIYMCFAYMEAGLQKLRHSGLTWFHWENFALILKTRPTVTPLGLWVSDRPVICSILATYSLFIELFAPLALLSTPLKIFFGLSLASLHIGTLLLMGSHGAFLTYSYCFIFWMSWNDLARLILRFRFNFKAQKTVEQH